MAFSFGKKEEKKPTTLEQVRKAYEDLSDDDKKTFRQSFEDRIDESVGEQEREDGNEDSQTAKDRIDEAEGAALADAEREETHDDEPPMSEQVVPQEEHADAKQDGEQIEAELAPLREEIAKLSARIDLIERTPQAVDDGLSKKLDSLSNLYNN